jgi:hypothetical protein
MKITIFEPISTGRSIQEIEVEDGTQVSDGYHTFGELYAHRIELWIALCKTLHFHTFAKDGGSPAWRSKLHSNGTCLHDWFVLGLNFKAGEQITYHLPMYLWGDCDFARTLDRAPEFDGHTSADVLKRLKRL